MTPSPNGRPPLTERQAELLMFVRAYRASHGKPPSVTQIARALKAGRGIATSTVSLHLLRIRAKGYEVPLASNNGVHPAGICSACPGETQVPDMQPERRLHKGPGRRRRRRAARPR
jgi:SOS-response transcriptional repressor LexA